MATIRQGRRVHRCRDQARLGSEAALAATGWPLARLRLTADSYGLDDEAPALKHRAIVFLFRACRLHNVQRRS
jgi:hypothetical protein